MMSLFALAVIATYDCETAKPAMIGLAGGQASVATLGLPAEMDKWKFTVKLESGNPIQSTVTWPGNPIQSEGKFPVMPTSESSYVLATYVPGPCMLTERGCLAQMSIVDQGPDSALVQIVPSAIARTGDARRPLLVVIEGTCKRSGAAQ